jgi:cbb3-type cytochrome oxidase maturation protein
MSVILILILASLAVALTFLAAFIWAVKAGQFEDTCTPAMRILSEDETGRTTGVRPSSGAATFASSEVSELPSVLGSSKAAAPEDGRTPARSPSIVAPTTVRVAVVGTLKR